MIRNREELLANLEVDDIFHARSVRISSLLCLVTRVTEESIEARVVTNQQKLSFDRRSGVAYSGSDLAPSTIDSVAPLPPDIYAVVRGLDRRMRLANSVESIKLSEAEKRFFPEIVGFYGNEAI